MSKDNLLVRVLGTMANPSVICTDMTGTLTQKEMTVAGSVSVHAKFVRSLEENRVWTSSKRERLRRRFGQPRQRFNAQISSISNLDPFYDRHRYDRLGTGVVIGKTNIGPRSVALDQHYHGYLRHTCVCYGPDISSPRSNPDKKADPLITVNMTKQILGQALAAYQIIITFALHFLGPRILGFHHTDDPTLQKHHAEIVQALVFNAFVFAQIFNLFDCRRLDEKFNVFEAVSKDRYFTAIISIEVVVQVLICLVGGAAFGVTRIGAREWCISAALGCVSLPLGALIRLIPNEPCERYFKRVQLVPPEPGLPDGFRR
ncbi:cation transporting ATPase [Lactarius deliciosus]|nr:cation transporting ATPase [Lactarius deliciosus]